MSPMVLAAVGIVGILTGAIAFVSNALLPEIGQVPVGWKRCRRCSILIGVLLGAGALLFGHFLSYRVKEADGFGRVVELPFTVAYFDREGFDYVGWITIPATVGNAVFWFLVPQFLLWTYARSGRKEAIASRE